MGSAAVLRPHATSSSPVVALVLLGPTAELHTGAHGGLVQSPPPGVTYLSPPHHHCFAFADGAAADPFRHPSLLEGIDYDIPHVMRSVVAGVHSSRLPVLGGVPWVADNDDLVLTLAYGRPLARGAGALPDLDSYAVQQRSAVMARAFLRPECVGVLLRTERARADAAAYVNGLPLLGRAEAEELVAKLDVVRVGVKATRTVRLRGQRPAIAYMGRSYDDKGGRVAARTFRALWEQRGTSVKLTWIGPCPDAVRAELPHVQFRELMPHAEFSGLLGETDIFVSPTRFESFGVGLAEAAAHGCALVLAGGPGLEHLTEVFDEGRHALFVSSTHSEGRQAVEFVSKIGALLDHEPVLRRMQEANAALAVRGPLSTYRRDKALTTYYSRLAETSQTASTTAGAGAGIAACHTFTEEEVLRRYAAHVGLPRRRLLRGHRPGLPVRTPGEID